MKRKIGFDEKSYKALQEMEASLFDTVEQLKELAARVMGPGYQVQDLEAYLKNPHDFIINAFWDTFCKHLPDHLDREHAFRGSVSINPAVFSELHKDYRDKYKALGSHAPTVGKKGLKSNLKEETFNIYLQPELQEEYEALERFIEAAKVLMEKHNATHPINLQRFARHIVVNGTGDIKPNPYVFGS